MILAGDIGGTKCNLALLDRQGEQMVMLHQRKFASRDYPEFSDILAVFLAGARDVIAGGRIGKIAAAGFGVAGPVIGNCVSVTNLGWQLEAEELAAQTGASGVVLLNDLEAMGYGLPWLAREEIFTLNPGVAVAHAAQALIAAGTGLGESQLHWNGTHYIVMPTEGGHCDFAPRTDQEIELLRWMKAIQEPVSWEMLLSGRGFRVLHEFLGPTVRHASFEDPIADPAPEITSSALDGTCPICVETLHLWVSLYGAEAGNLALKTLAMGGVFVAGGIVARIMPKMTDGTFLSAFSRKSRFSELLSRIPVYVVLSQDAPVLGAAAVAVRGLGA